MQTTGGAIILRCYSVLSSAATQFYESTIMATQVGGTSGPIVSSATAPHKAARQPGR